MIFEISKIIFDTYENILTYKFILVLCLIAIILFFVPMLDLFQWNFIFLCLFIALRQVKQLYIHKKDHQMVYKRALRLCKNVV